MSRNFIMALGILFLLLAAALVAVAVYLIRRRRGEPGGGAGAPPPPSPSRGGALALLDERYAEAAQRRVSRDSSADNPPPDYQHIELAAGESLSCGAIGRGSARHLLSPKGNPIRKAPQHSRGAFLYDSGPSNAFRSNQSLPKSSAGFKPSPCSL